MKCLICGVANLTAYEDEIGMDIDDVLGVCEPCLADATLGRDAKAELARLRAENGRLRGALKRLADEEYWKNKSILFGAFTASAMVEIAKEAISRAEQAKMEVEK